MHQFCLSAVGSIVSTCDLLDANTLMNLVEMLAASHQEPAGFSEGPRVLFSLWRLGALDKRHLRSPYNYNE